MESFTVYLAVHTEANSPEDAVTNVERLLSHIEKQAEGVGLIFDSQGHVTDENGENVDLPER